MPQRYVQAILKYLASREYQPLKPRQLARQMGVAEEDYGTFREAVKILRDSGHAVLGSGNALTLPEMSSTVVGTYRANPRGFGFVLPEMRNAHGDLYIPEGESAGAMTGDTVEANVLRRGRRGGEMLYHGRIVRIIQRGSPRVVGTLEQAEGNWFVVPDGRAATAPVVIRDVGPGARAGQKVVAEIVRYPEPGELASGVIVENIGAAGEIEAETVAIIRSHGMPAEFDAAAMDEARRAMDGFEPDAASGREDLTRAVVITIDPPDARDFDDAISLVPEGRGGASLGVHIADVSRFVRAGAPLDQAARERGNSVYFPRKVLPMLPEVLSNGVCSLQAGEKRFCKSVFIRYDAGARVVGSRLAETVIRSTARLTYAEAQEIIDGKRRAADGRVADLLKRMDALARKIQARRRAQGMIQLDLPEIEPVLDEAGKVVDAVEQDGAFTHTIIEMFMVEANEAVAGALDRRDVPFLRRVHPAPDQAAGKQLASFLRVCGHRLPRDLDRHGLQSLLAAVKGRPEEYAVNLAVLKSFQQAEYSPMRIGHYALASRNYCHFTSPIRRYADLTVHRLVEALVQGRGTARAGTEELVNLGQHCTMTERRAEAAERELVTVLVLQLLAGKVGQAFEGVVTGVANFGIFVQLAHLGIEGLIRMADLGDDWWEVSIRNGEIRGERTGRRFRIGDPLTVRVASVNLPARQLNLVPAREQSGFAPRPRHAPQPPQGAKPRLPGAKPGAGTRRRRGRKK